MFVLTQLPTFPPITKFFARKGDPSLCTEGAERAWTSAGLVLDLDRVWSWWLLGCLEVTGGRSPVLPSHFWAASLDWPHFFYYNEKVCLQKKRLSWT